MLNSSKNKTVTKLSPKVELIQWVETPLRVLIFPTHVKSPQVEMHILEKNIVSKVRGDVDSVLLMVETSIQQAVVTATENLLVPMVELAMNSVNVLS